MTYTIVSEGEANLKEGKISVNTPIAQGLLGKKAVSYTHLDVYKRQPLMERSPK